MSISNNTNVEHLLEEPPARHENNTYTFPKASHNASMKRPSMKKWHSSGWFSCCGGNKDKSNNREKKKQNQNNIKTDATNSGLQQTAHGCRCQQGQIRNSLKVVLAHCREWSIIMIMPITDSATKLNLHQRSLGGLPNIKHHQCLHIKK